MLNLLIALPLAAAMLVTLRWCWEGDTWGMATLLLLCIVWLRADKAFEGPQVLGVTHNHALVLSDLFPLVVAVSGIVGWLHGRRIFERLHGRRSGLRDRAAAADPE